MERVLITGGAGYIGSHTSKLSASNGFEPVCYDSLITGHKKFVKWGPLEIGDLSDTNRIIDVVKQYKPVAVIHFAASAYVGESVNNPYKYYKNNVGGTLSLLEAMRSTGLNNIVFSSTCATYGIPSTKLINEKCLQRPINPYGKSKLMIEQILDDLSNQGEINHISLRYFNAAGADSECEIGEEHDPETHLIPLAIFSAMGGKYLSVFGTDFPTPDGTAIRDYIHVEDLASAHLLSLKYLMRDGKSDFFNLGIGKGSSVREIITTLKQLGLNAKSVDAPRREGDPAVLVADATKANRVLKWLPKYKDIKDVLLTAIAWHQKHDKNTSNNC